MPQVATKTRKNAKFSEGSVWLAYDRAGFTVLGNPSKSPTGLQDSAKRPHGNAFASPRKSYVGTDASGTVVETLDYYPYGGIRLDNKVGSTNEQRKYVGTEFDQGINFGIVIEGTIFLALGYFISRYKVWAAGTAAILLTLDTVFAFIATAENNPGVGWLLVKIVFIIILFRGFLALRRLKVVSS